MKKINYFIMLLALSLSLSSCVDKEFDFSKIDDSDITIGNSYSIPIGAIEVDLIDLWDVDYSSASSEETKSDDMCQFIVPPAFYEDFEIGAGFDSSLIDDILNVDSMKIMIIVESPLPDDIELTLDISFSYSYSNIVDVFDGLKISTDELKAELDITSELLTSIAESNMVHCSFDTTSGAGTFVTLPEDSTISVKLVLIGEGGVNLF